MSKLKASILTAGSLALAMSGGAALAAGVPTGTPQAGVFSIDDAAFDAGNIGATACPAGFTCNELIGSGGDMLQREIVDNGTNERVLQLIIGESDGTDSFAVESQNRFDTTNNIDSKMIMDEQSQQFYTEQTMFRGESDPSGGFPQQETLQILAGGFQTFTMTATDMFFNSDTVGNNDALEIAIDQNAGTTAGVFAHRILKGGGLVSDFSVSAGGDDITVVGGNADGGLTATYIGANARGDFSPVANTANNQFGVLIYRYWDDVNANSAGVTGAGDPADQEIRGTSAVPSDEGGMLGGHGLFNNGNASDLGWDDTLFGAAPDPF